MPEVPSIHDWETNGDLIADVARLGHLKAEWFTLDATYGPGGFWTRWRPHRLITVDKRPRAAVRADFRALPFPAGTFDAVVLDAPYKLNGRPDPTVDERYGVDEPARWQDRMALIRAGMTECVRVLAPQGNLLVKAMDQVCSGRKRWQTDEVTTWAAQLGLGKVDRFDMTGHRRPQPAGRRQVHSAGMASTLMVFRRGWHTSDLPARYHDDPSSRQNEERVG